MRMHSSDQQSYDTDDYGDLVDQPAPDTYTPREPMPSAHERFAADGAVTHRFNGRVTADSTSAREVAAARVRLVEVVRGLSYDPAMPALMEDDAELVAILEEAFPQGLNAVLSRTAAHIRAWADRQVVRVPQRQAPGAVISN